MTALRRAGEPDDIGPMIASLLSEDNRVRAAFCSVKNTPLLWRRQGPVDVGDGDHHGQRVER